MTQKIVVRYPAGASGRFLACLIETLRNPEFKFNMDSNNGVHTLEDPSISEYVAHTHDLLIKCLLDHMDSNKETVLKLVQVMARRDKSKERVVTNFFYKCIKPFWQVGIVDTLTEKHYGWTNHKWSVDQLLSKDLTQDLYELLMLDLHYIPENVDVVVNHSDLMTIDYSAIDNDSLIDQLCDHLQLPDTNKDYAVKLLQDYRSKNNELYKITFNEV